jgi:hypothetical protein
VIALAAISSAVLALRTDVLGSFSSDYIAPGLPFLRDSRRVLVGLTAVPEFFRLLLFPLNLSADYSPAVIEPVSHVTALVIAGGILLLAVLVLARRTPVSFAGLAGAWFALTILPISNLLFPIGVVVAERLLYLPSVALAIAVAYAWQRSALHPSGSGAARTCSGQSSFCSRRVRSCATAIGRTVMPSLQRSCATIPSRTARSLRWAMRCSHRIRPRPVRTTITPIRPGRTIPSCFRRSGGLRLRTATLHEA